ncbi:MULTISPECIES: hypothetical protein [unclassified Blastococcus]
MTPGSALALAREGRDASAGTDPETPPGAAVRAFLTGYAVTVLPLVAGLLALQGGWIRSGAGSWPAAAAVLAGWSLAVAAWLRSRRWPAGTVDLVVLAPVLVLAGPLSLGWLSPGGLVVWGPVSTLLTVALASSAGPPTLDS